MSRGVVSASIPASLAMRRAGREEADLVAPQRSVGADHRGHVVALLHGAEQGAADRRVVEGRVQVVEAGDARTSPVGSWISSTTLRLRRSSGCRSRGRLLPPVHLAVLQARRRRCAASGITCHSTRSKCTRLGPAVQVGVPSARGT